jgi:hypothetical protein
MVVVRDKLRALYKGDFVLSFMLRKIRKDFQSFLCTPELNARRSSTDFRP